jgi:hypothetical protein
VVSPVCNSYERTLQWTVHYGVSCCSVKNKREN